MANVDISGLDKRQLLLELARNAANPLAAFNALLYTEEQAADALDKGHIDYFAGVAIKTSLSGDTADFRLYDRDQGEGHGAQVVAKYRNNL